MKHSASKNARARRGGAVFTIAEECERLFCETLRTIFLGEGGMVLQDSLAVGTALDSMTDRTNTRSPPAGQTITANAMPYLQPLASAYTAHHRLVTEWLEMYDYAGGARFRGYIAEGVEGRSMFVFFDAAVLDNDLKPGLMALLELCGIPEVECSKLVICLDRAREAEVGKGLLRDLGWVGFEPTTLAEWTDTVRLVSERWMLLSMDA